MNKGQVDSSSMVDVDALNKARWAAALSAAFPSGVPRSASWTDVVAIINILGPFCGMNLNHTMLPRGGGMDMDGIEASRERGCIEFRRSPDLAYICRPSRLYFEHISRASWESFLLLETEFLPSSGVYESLSYSHERLGKLPAEEYFDLSHLDAGLLGYAENDDEFPGVYKPLAYPHEELLELPGGEYRDRSQMDAGFLGYDENGYEIPIPDSCRLVSRFPTGKFLLVATSSLWNRTSATYDGRHNQMSHSEIRILIEAALR